MAVLTSTHNLCFEQKHEKYQKFLSEILHFWWWKSLYLNRHVFVMWSHFACICNSIKPRLVWIFAGRTCRKARMFTDVAAHMGLKTDICMPKDDTKCGFVTFITKTRLFKYILNFTSKNWKFSNKKTQISAQNIDCEYSLESHRRGDSDE